MDLRFYKDETERDLRATLENLIIEAEEFSSLSNEQENEEKKEAYLSKARERKAEMKRLVKSLYGKNPNNTLFESFSKENDQAEKHALSKVNNPELKRLAHIKNVIRKGRWLSTKKPTIVNEEEFAR